MHVCGAATSTTGTYVYACMYVYVHVCMYALQLDPQVRIHEYLCVHTYHVSAITMVCAYI